MEGGLLWLLLGGSLSGAAIAGIARGIMPGKQMMSGLATLVIGTAAGFVGGLIAGLLGMDDNSGWSRIWPLLISVGIAVVTIIVWINYRNNKLHALVTPKPRSAGTANESKAESGDKPDKGTTSAMGTNKKPEPVEPKPTKKRRN